MNNLQYREAEMLSEEINNFFFTRILSPKICISAIGLSAMEIRDMQLLSDPILYQSYSIYSTSSIRHHHHVQSRG